MVFQTDNRPLLPDELLCQVLYLLEVDELLRCSAASRYFHTLIVESSRLQFTLELDKYCMLPLLPPSDFPPYSTRLKLIREREARWRSPENWGPVQKLALPPTGSVYEFAGGYYANGREDNHRLTSGISFFELPSTEPSTEDSPGRMWTHSMGDIRIVDFTMDPAQDLLILVALAPAQSDFVYELHLRSLTTNEPHPESSLPMGIFSCLSKSANAAANVPTESTGAVRIQITGDLLALLIKEVQETVRAHLEIWNWRHGGNNSCSMAKIEGIEDFTFLSDATFLIVRPLGRFEYYEFKNPVLGQSDPRLKSSYALPPLAEGFVYWYICMSSNPSPGYFPPTAGYGKRVYYPKPDERLQACCLYVFKPNGPGDHPVHSFVFFLNVKIFLEGDPSRRHPGNDPIGFSDGVSPSMIQNHTGSRRQRHLRTLLMAEGEIIPWEKWGPENTRWFDEALSTDWQHALYGLKSVECIDRIADWASDSHMDDKQVRSVSMAAADGRLTQNLPTVNDLLNGVGFDVDDDDDEVALVNGVPSRVKAAHRHLRIRDYNPYSLQLDAQESAGREQSPWVRRVVCEPSILSSRGVFAHDIQSSLPYSELISRMTFRVTDVMMDDSRILLMQRGRAGKLKSIDILSM